MAPSESSEVISTWESIKELCLVGWEEEFQWIPSHGGFQVDELAKAGSEQERPHHFLEYNTTERLLDIALKQRRHAASAESDGPV